MEKLERDPKNRNNSVWKFKEKLFPRISKTLPIAKNNKEGQLITNHTELKSVYLEHFIHRLRQRPILTEFSEYKKEVENEFKILLCE